MVYGAILHFMRVKLSSLNNPLIKSAIFLLVSLLIIGCYNNSHIRTQRVLNEGQPVISGYSSLNLIAPEMDTHDYLSRSGIAGLRIGLSYLGVHRGYEQGVSLGVGLVDGDLFDFILGYDIRTVKSNTKGRPYRYGLYVESNNISKSSYGLAGGSVFQIRPYLMSITSRSNNWYGGFHGILGFGTLTYKNSDGYYDGYTWIQQSLENDYSVSSLGVGVSMGNETRVMNFLAQTQLDISMVSQNHQWIDQGYDNSEPWSNSGPVITISTALHRAPPRATRRIIRPLVSNSLASITPGASQSAPTVRYDPFTGEQIIDSPKTTDMTFDPYTGETLPQTSPQKFDPYTGLPVQTNATMQKESPYSLLMPNEQSLLLSKVLRISKLNGQALDATLLDVMDTGLLINRELTYGNIKQELLLFGNIRNLHFVGDRKGMSGVIPGITKACGLCVGLPLAAGLMLDSPDIAVMGIAASPIALIGGVVYGAMAREPYPLEFVPDPNPEAKFGYRGELISELVRQYISSGFPVYDQQALQVAINASKNTGPQP